jgi:hypothetical protein
MGPHKRERGGWICCVRYLQPWPGNKKEEAISTETASPAGVSTRPPRNVPVNVDLEQAVGLLHLVGRESPLGRRHRVTLRGELHSHRSRVSVRAEVQTAAQMDEQPSC